MDQEPEILRYLGKWKSYDEFGRDISDGLKQVCNQIINFILNFLSKFIEFKFLVALYIGIVLLARNGPN